MSGKKIVSNLAQYKNGQLTCIVCNVAVKSELYWTGHVNGRAHRDSLIQLKRKAEAPSSSSTQQAKRSRVDNNGEENKSKAVPSTSKTPSDIEDRIIFKVPQDRRPQQKVETTTVPPPPQESPPKEFEKNGSTDNNYNPTNSFIKYQNFEGPQSMEEEEDDNEAGPSQDSKSNKGKKEPTSNLPEGFFDDPKLDAKVRGIEFVDPEDAEWDRFVKEIASEELQSESILVVDEEESRKERELDEIEEMMGHWQKVIDLEKKKETRVKKMETTQQDEQSSGDEEDFGEELDWRAKKLKRF